VARREQTDLLLQPELETVDLLNWQAFQRAIDAGYAHARSRLEPLPESLVNVLRSGPNPLK